MPPALPPGHRLLLITVAYHQADGHVDSGDDADIPYPVMTTILDDAHLRHVLDRLTIRTPSQLRAFAGWAATARLGDRLACDPQGPGDVRDVLFVCVPGEFCDGRTTDHRG